jgi:hypothetical protein
MTRYFALVPVALTSASPLSTQLGVPEVIPGPGLPSLASLNVTSEDLHAMGLAAIPPSWPWPVTASPNLRTYIPNQFHVRTTD